MNPFEPERYELQEGPAYTFDLNRRDIFKLLGGGIVILSIISEASGQEADSFCVPSARAEAANEFAFSKKAQRAQRRNDKETPPRLCIWTVWGVRKSFIN